MALLLSNCDNFRKQKVMLKDVAWKQERMMMSFDNFASQTHF